MFINIYFVSINDDENQLAAYGVGISWLNAVGFAWGK